MITISEYLKKTPWDERAIGVPTYEIKTVSAEFLDIIGEMEGHFTVKVDPLFSKKILNDYGFYYCDTLIEPYCTPDTFISFKNDAIRISKACKLDDLLSIAHGAFMHGRFHRDFNIRKELADLRYDLWLKDLYDAGSVLALIYGGDLAGFFGISGNRIVLNAVSEKFRGRGLAKYLWSVACGELFLQGWHEIESSISASNMPAINLYASVGFRFRNPLDVYHRLNTRASE